MIYKYRLKIKFWRNIIIKNKTLIFGHTNPDNDSVLTAIAWEYLCKNIYDNEYFEAISLGKLGLETRYALDYFSLKSPRILSEISNESNSVMLVDHNELQQSAPDINKVTIKAVLDHHKIDNFKTDQPMYFRCEPVGCAATILLSMYKEHEVSIPDKIAGLMLASIITDTVLLKSPATTKLDQQAAVELAKIANVKDYKLFGLNMLKTGTDYTDRSPEQLIIGGSKTVRLYDSDVRLRQLTTDDFSKVKELDSQSIMNKYLKNNPSHKLFILLVTDILKGGAELIIEGDKSGLEKLLGHNLNLVKEELNFDDLKVLMNLV